jgi:hypothetical protein
MSRGQAIDSLFTATIASSWLVVLAALTTVELHAQPGVTVTRDSPGAEIRLDTRTPYFELESRLAVGNKGEQSLDVGVPAEECGLVWVFDHAELTILDNRFGDAQLVEIPEPGCVRCRSLRVRWYHEPTGRIHFRVDVYRRSADVLCGSL